MLQNDKSLTLIKEVLRTADAIGYEATLQANISARGPQNQQLTPQERDKTILAEACKIFDITLVELNQINGRGRRIDALYAIFAYFKNHIHYSNNEITTKVFYCDNTLVSKYYGKFNQLKTSIKNDADIINKYNNLVEVLKNKI